MSSYEVMILGGETLWHKEDSTLEEKSLHNDYYPENFTAPIKKRVFEIKDKKDEGDLWQPITYQNNIKVNIEINIENINVVLQKLQEIKDELELKISSTEENKLITEKHIESLTFRAQELHDEYKEKIEVLSNEYQEQENLLISSYINQYIQNIDSEIELLHFFILGEEESIKEIKEEVDSSWRIEEMLKKIDKAYEEITYLENKKAEPFKIEQFEIPGLNQLKEIFDTNVQKLKNYTYEIENRYLEQEQTDLYKQLTFYTEKLRKLNDESAIIKDKITKLIKEQNKHHLHLREISKLLQNLLLKQERDRRANDICASPDPLSSESSVPNSPGKIEKEREKEGERNRGLNEALNTNINTNTDAHSCRAEEALSRSLPVASRAIVVSRSLAINSLAQELRELGIEGENCFNHFTPSKAKSNYVDEDIISYMESPNFSNNESKNDISNSPANKIPNTPVDDSSNNIANDTYISEVQLSEAILRMEASSLLVELDQDEEKEVKIQGIEEKKFIEEKPIIPKYVNKFINLRQNNILQATLIVIDKKIIHEISAIESIDYKIAPIEVLKIIEKKEAKKVQVQITEAILDKAVDSDTDLDFTVNPQNKLLTLLVPKFYQALAVKPTKSVKPIQFTKPLIPENIMPLNNYLYPFNIEDSASNNFLPKLKTNNKENNYNFTSFNGIKDKFTSNPSEVNLSNINGDTSLFTAHHPQTILQQSINCSYSQAPMNYLPQERYIPEYMPVFTMYSWELLNLNINKAVEEKDLRQVNLQYLQPQQNKATLDYFIPLLKFFSIRTLKIFIFKYLLAFKNVKHKSFRRNRNTF